MSRRDGRIEQDHVVHGGSTPVLGVTRALGAVIVPFLVAAWAILYLVPDRTEQLFAWPVSPSMTAMMLGGVYLGGAYFFVRVILSRSWEEIALGFLPVVGFASLMGLATILHWDLFTSGHLAFQTWWALYFTTPFLVLGTWWANQRLVASSATAAGTDEVVLSQLAQVIARTLGVVAVVIALALFVRPQQLIDVWPWQLTPLSARVMAAMFVLGGAGIGVARDHRWRAVRLLVQVAWVMLALILLAVARAWDQFDPANPLTWVFVAVPAAVLVSSAVLYRRMEHRRVARAS